MYNLYEIITRKFLEELAREVIKKSTLVLADQATRSAFEYSKTRLKERYGTESKGEKKADETKESKEDKGSDP